MLLFFSSDGGLRKVLFEWRFLSSSSTKVEDKCHLLLSVGTVSDEQAWQAEQLQCSKQCPMLQQKGLPETSSSLPMAELFHYTIPVLRSCVLLNLCLWLRRESPTPLRHRWLQRLIESQLEFP